MTCARRLAGNSGPYRHPSSSSLRVEPCSTRSTNSETDEHKCDCFTAEDADEISRVCFVVDQVLLRVLCALFLCVLCGNAVAVALRTRNPDARATTRYAAGASQRPAQLLLARDVHPAGHERSELVHLVAGRTRGHLLDARLALAPARRIDDCDADHERRHVRLPAGLVARRTLHRVLGLRRTRPRAHAARSPHG